MTQITALFTTTEEGNLAFHVKDNPSNVLANHKKLASKLDMDVENIKYMNQVHSNNVQIVTASSPKETLNCDGIITQDSNIALMVMVADCIPILMHDSKQGVIAAVHAGRNSTFERIVVKTVEKMRENFGCQPCDIKVVLGPSIQKCCYEVSPQMAQIVQTSFGKQFVQGRNIDLQGINEHLLVELGVKEIEISKICTKCSSKPYYSYRVSNETGRFCGIIIKKDI